MNERLKQVRKSIEGGLNQSEFGKRLGVTAAAISKIESGERALTEQMIISTCREFGINETWLRTGHGEMRVLTENTLMRQLAEERNLDAIDVHLIESYIALPKPAKDVLKNYLKRFAHVDGWGEEMDRLMGRKPTTDDFHGIQKILQSALEINDTETSDDFPDIKQAKAILDAQKGDRRKVQ